MIKKIKLPPHVEVSVTTLQNSKVLVFISQKHSKYMIISKQFNFSKKDNVLSFKAINENQNNHFELNQFYLSALKCLNSFEKPFKKRLMLKGLGFRIGVSEDISFLELKLGYSHILKVRIPTDHITVKIDKNYLNIEGFDKIKVGNFSNQIRNLKYPDSYKGKGFWYKDEIRVLKEIKKT